MVINSQRQNAGAAQVKPAALKRSLDVELVLSPSLPLSLSLSLSFCNSQIFLKWIKFYVYFFLSSFAFPFSCSFAFPILLLCQVVSKMRFETFCCQFDGDEHLKRIFQLANLLHSRLKPNLDLTS